MKLFIIILLVSIASARHIPKWSRLEVLKDLLFNDGGSTPMPTNPTTNPTTTSKPIPSNKEMYEMIVELQKAEKVGEKIIGGIKEHLEKVEDALDELYKYEEEREKEEEKYKFGEKEVRIIMGLMKKLGIDFEELKKIIEGIEEKPEPIDFLLAIMKHKMEKGENMLEFFKNIMQGKAMKEKRKEKVGKVN